MIQEIISSFKHTYEQQPQCFRASGRVNIIGEHTDYNNGFALPIAIDRSIYFALCSNQSNVMRISSFNRKEEITVDLQELTMPDKDWPAYIMAILILLKEEHLHVEGMDIMFGGDIPIGAGLSSSAAMCCCFIYALNTIFDFHQDYNAIARLAQRAEHLVGLNCGLLDQYAIMHGLENKVLHIDFDSLEYKSYPFKLDDIEWIIINSNLPHNLVEGSEYNARRASCQRVVQMISHEHTEVHSLRNIDHRLLQDYKDQINPVDYNRALFIIEENIRVLKALDLILESDSISLGALLYESHQGQSELYEISTKQIDLLIGLTKDQEDILGARMTGGGFGGCVICLVKKGRRAAVEKVAHEYHVRTGILPAIYDIRICQGITRINASEFTRS